MNEPLMEAGLLRCVAARLPAVPPVHSSADTALTSFHIISQFKSSRAALVLLPALRRRLGSNLVARRGCFLRGGQWLHPSVFISEPGWLWAGASRIPLSTSC